MAWLDAAKQPKVSKILKMKLMHRQHSCYDQRGRVGRFIQVEFLHFSLVQLVEFCFIISQDLNMVSEVAVLVSRPCWVSLMT